MREDDDRGDEGLGEESERRELYEVREGSCHAADGRLNDIIQAALLAHARSEGSNVATSVLFSKWSCLSRVADGPSAGCRRGPGSAMRRRPEPPGFRNPERSYCATLSVLWDCREARSLVWRA